MMNKFLMQVNEDTITSLLENEEQQTPPPKRLKLSVPTGAKLAKMVGRNFVILFSYFYVFQTRWVKWGRWGSARK